MMILASFARAVVEQAERCGVDRGELLQAVHLDPALLEDPESRISMDKYSELQERAVRASGDEAFGLHMAEQAGPDIFGMLGYLGMHTRTLREAIGVFLRYHRVVSSAPGSALVEEGSRAKLIYDFPRSSPVCDRLRGDFGLTTLVRIGRSYFDDIVPLEVGFEHARPGYVEAYHRHFGDRIAFEQDCTYVLMERRWLDLPQRNGNPRLCRLLRREAEQMLVAAEAKLDVGDAVRRGIVALHRGCTPGMDVVASELGMSARTLRRRLRSEGLRYAELVDEALGAVAMRHLDDHERTIEDAAFAMGFSSASSFHRAFKRWTGITPGAYRHRARVDPLPGATAAARS